MLVHCASAISSASSSLAGVSGFSCRPLPFAIPEASSPIYVPVSPFPHANVLGAHSVRGGCSPVFSVLYLITQLATAAISNQQSNSVKRIPFAGGRVGLLRTAAFVLFSLHLHHVHGCGCARVATSVCMIMQFCVCAAALSLTQRNAGTCLPAVGECCLLNSYARRQRTNLVAI
jgi:hypothetical protein